MADLVMLSCVSIVLQLLARLKVLVEAPSLSRRILVVDARVMEPLDIVAILQSGCIIRTTVFLAHALVTSDVTLTTILTINFNT
jgi:hypothetical protein